MNIGILGTGHIARKMAATIGGMDGVTLAAAASRTPEKAAEFAKTFSTKVCTYDELARDNSIDLIYIATPHSRHYDDCMLCLKNGRNVLCEKSFTANKEQASEVIDYAEENGLFVSEAMWTRFMPMRFTLDNIIESGIIGHITSLTANLGYAISDKERIAKPELAGGALLDLGVYTLNFASMIFGENITDIKSSCVKNEYGVDLQNSIILIFDGKRTAVLHSNAAANTDRRGIIYGSRGRIEVENINNCQGINVILNDGRTERYDTPPQISGYEYEVESAVRAISEKKTECPEMAHSDTLFIMGLMDSLRAGWGIRYPFEL